MGGWMKRWVCLVLLGMFIAPRPAAADPEDVLLTDASEKAWRKDDPRWVDSYLSAGRPLNPSGQNETPLHNAARADKLNIARELFKRGAEVDARGGNNFTPLHQAAMNGNADMVRFLLAHKADINAKDDLEETPFFKALVERRRTVVDVLMDFSPEVNGASLHQKQTPLILAIFQGYFDVAVELIRRGADVDAREVFLGNAPLHFAVQQKHAGLVRLLLDKGADPMVKNKFGRTPAEQAERLGLVDIAETLQEAARQK
jgi:ankyrin repeat protein